MKHVIYHTEYYNRNEMFCLREEECDAYFNTIPEDSSALQETIPPIGCRLLLPKLVPSRLTKEQWEHLRIKKPDYELKYASLCDGENGEYSIYAIYEKWLGDEKDGEISEVLPVCISFGENDDVTLDMHVIPIDYTLIDKHITRWDEALFEGTNISRAGNYITIIASPGTKEDKKVIIYHNGWTIVGKWDTMEQVSKGIFVYHCCNSLFRFSVTINIERESWDGDYESLLHE